MEIIKKTGNSDFKILKMSKKNTGPILEILCKKFSNGEKKTWKKFFRMEKYPKKLRKK